ncbi:MAG TPA: invasion-associated locus B family protein, partial [Afipia sp.]|nr:invasion-associated locus B family protein [Afipia sp.]
MNFRILAAQASPRGRVFAALTAGAFLAAASYTGTLAS